MMNGHLNQMRQAAEQATQGRANTRTAIVTSYDPNTYSCKVQIQPEGVETGWIPVGTQWVGNGWGMYCPPTPGDMVKVEFQEGSMSAGMTDVRFFNDVERPLTVPSGEFWLVHKSGAFFKLQNDGTGTFSDGHGAQVKLNGDGTVSSTGAWTHTGTFHATQDISSDANVIDHKSSMDDMRDTYNGHKHSITEAPPIQQM